LQVRVSELRKALRSALEADRLVTRPPGYLIRVQPEELDALRFDRLAAFDGPARAIRCAAALRRSAAGLGLAARFGIHVGEVELAGGEVTGVSVRRAAEIAALARPGEILVSRTVSDLVAGSEIAFADRGRHQLTGISDPWPVFAVAGT
jgi:class 3 adenylate cyclase